MSRIIRFRGKRVDNKEWIYGYYFLGCDNNHYIKTLEDVPSGQRHNDYEVIPETVGEFIGLHDKNGTEIYEGDNFKDERAHGDYCDDVSEIMFKDGKFGFPNYGIFDTDIDCDYIEIIGSVHDNTELLK